MTGRAMVELFRTCRAILKNLFFTFEPRWNAISRKEFVSSILSFLKIFSVLFWFLFSVNVFVYSSASFSFVCPFYSTCPFSVTSRSVSQPFILVGHILGLFPCFLCLFVLSLSVSQSDTQSINSYVKLLSRLFVRLFFCLFSQYCWFACLLFTWFVKF